MLSESRAALNSLSNIKVVSATATRDRRISITVAISFLDLLSVWSEIVLPSMILDSWPVTWFAKSTLLRAAMAVRASRRFGLQQLYENEVISKCTSWRSVLAFDR
jgi:hypothetical protein